MSFINFNDPVFLVLVVAAILITASYFSRARVLEQKKEQVEFERLELEKLALISSQKTGISPASQERLNTLEAELKILSNDKYTRAEKALLIAKLHAQTKKDIEDIRRGRSGVS